VVLGQYHTSLAALTAQHGTRVPNVGNDEHRRSPSTWWVHEQRHRRGGAGALFGVAMLEGAIHRPKGAVDGGA